jgi:DNA repair protein RecN (Recombination protein N)
MLKKLIIRNFAIIDNIEIEFDKGLNIIIGETGAGKSIIISALQLLLGERANTDIVRNGKNKAILEAVFSIDNNSEIKKYLKENEYDNFDSDLVIRREIFSKSSGYSISSRNFVNDTPVQINFLKQISEMLIDFHNQHDNHTLLKPENHIYILDKVRNIEITIDEYSILYDKLNARISELKSLINKENQLREKVEFNKFLLDEITKIDPKENEDIELENKLRILQNSEFLFSSSSFVADSLLQNDNSVHSVLSEVIKQIESLGEIDDYFEEYLNELHSAAITFKEIAGAASEYKNNIEFNPEAIEEIRKRLQELKLLQKKYGSVNDAIEKKNILVKELKYAENFDIEIDKLKKEIFSDTQKLSKSYEKLHVSRKSNLEVLRQYLKDNLINLGISYVEFNIDLQSDIIDDENKIYNYPAVRFESQYIRAYEYGATRPEFLISTNRGEEPKPLAKIASGGEISRIMLVIKQLLSENDNIPVFVFDEIDTGISGKTAQKVGIEIKKLSDKHQIIAITHLPQIAALGDRVYSVEKSEKNGTTSSYVNILEGDKKHIEIAKMLSGESVSDDAIKSAKQLSLIQ